MVQESSTERSKTLTFLSPLETSHHQPSASGGAITAFKSVVTGRTSGHTRVGSALSRAGLHFAQQPQFHCFCLLCYWVVVVFSPYGKGAGEQSSGPG